VVTERAERIDEWIEKLGREEERQREGERERERERELGTGLTGVEEIPVTSIFHVC